MTDTIVKIPRDELIAELVVRDGLACMFPDCNGQLDLSVKDGPLEVTIDHWMPQHFGRANGWTREEIWHIDNLKLMHKKCNAKKGDRIPLEDGTLPVRETSNFRFRRQKRANRPDAPCEFCDNGHNLSIGEVCAQCGVNAQAFPRWAKVKANECDHAAFWCWACSIGVTPRLGATEMIVIGGEGGE